MCQIYLPTDTVNQCVKIIYQQTQSTTVSKLSTRRHSQPMCKIYLPTDSQPMCKIYLSKDTVNQCVQIIYQKTQSTNVLIRSRKSQDRLHNDQKIKDKRTNNDVQNTTYKTKDRVTRTVWRYQRSNQKP
jgi:hypothetical protein